MWPDRVSNPGPLTYESGALPTAQRSPAQYMTVYFKFNCYEFQLNICLGLNIAFLAKVHVNEFCFRWGMLINLLHL